MPTAEADYEELIRRNKETALLGSCAAVLGWDERTYMPRNGSALRGDQMGLLARMTHEAATAPEVGELLARLESSPFDAEDPAAANVREIRRTHDRAVKLPKRLVEELARTTTRAQQAWQEARQNNAFATFLPWLEKVVALKREEAEAVGYKAHPYDALLDEYEAGATAAEITRLFAGLAAELVPLVAAITSAPRRPRRDLLERHYPVDRQEAFGRAAAEAIGFDFASGRLDVTAHPFCSGIGPGDVRITTRYHPNRFAESFFGILHEAGHGIYEQGLPAEHFGTPLGNYASLGIHESQSRLWENQVGRSGAFWEYFFPKAREAFPSALGDVPADDFFFAINDVRRSFIRVEADEVTYNLHVVLRFELEQGLLTGDLKPADLPGAWNERFAKAFGLTPADDSHGCLQDIHWSMGGLGYFPTYTLGNLYAAQFTDQARADLGDLDGDIRAGRFGPMKEWLGETIFQHGRRYPAGELCLRATGEPLSHGPFLAYLRRKYEPLYELD